MSNIDLHTHSTASDGTDSPRRIAELAAGAGLAAVALTDHDTVAGIPEFLAAAQDFPQLECIPGVELAASYSARELHFVGLWIDPDSAGLQNYLELQRRERLRRNNEIRRKLISLGYDFTWDEPEFLSAPDLSHVGRPHFARLLCRRFGFESPQRVFDKLLGHNRAAYVRRELPSPELAVRAIKSAGGVAVWAHPTYRERNERAWLKRICQHFVPCGLDAMEAYYSLFSAKETTLVSEVAALFHLGLSGGSDYHGSVKTDIQIGTGMGGLRVPAELLEELKKRRQHKDFTP